eukprot:4849757-Pyramimonas_sp.AAC.1
MDNSPVPVCKQNTVTIMVTDSCPCDHPNPENKINCCGDEPHIDLSAWAYRSVSGAGGRVIHYTVRYVQYQ